MFLQSSIKENAVCTRVCVCLLFIPPLLCLGFGVVLYPPSARVPKPRHSHAASQSKMLPRLGSPLAPSTAATHGVFGAVWSPEKEVMGIGVL